MPGKLITVSNRLPYRFSVLRSGLVTTLSVGGLATALCSYFENTNIARSEFDGFHWVGVSDISKKSFEKVSHLDVVEKDSIIMHPVFLPTQMQDKFYDGFCNSVLWPLFLYFPSFVVYKQEFFDEYVNANAVICKKILEVYQPGDTIWVHDYHWMLLPALLRESLPHAKIGFFLHIPFPSFELFRLLPKPWRTHLISGVLGADVIGFQTDEFSKHFVDSVHHTFPEFQNDDGRFIIHDRVSQVKSFSISIDYEKFNLASRTPEVIKKVKRMRERLRVNTVVLSVDRLDYTKAIFNRLESFDLFLEQNPDLREQVTYILLLVPTRESILKYKENKLNVESLISRINGKYSTLDWTPIVYQYKSVDFKELIALYGVSDIALIVPSRDGMNLVAKEFVACRQRADGVLILSETAGAASELSEAILVNANDRQEIADSILMAIRMPREEQHGRMERMQSHIKTHDVLAWAADFLDAFHTVCNTTEMEYDKSC